MAKRWKIASVLAAATAVVIWIAVSTLRSPVSLSPEGTAAETSVSSSPFAPPKNRSGHRETSETAPDQRASEIPNTRSDYARLQALERAAIAGDPKAQFRLANAMRHCANLFAYTDESLRDLRDPLRREYVLQGRKSCEYFATRRRQLIDAAFDWEHRAIEAGDPAARARQIALDVGNRDLPVGQIAEHLRPLLASNDPFVFGVIYSLGTWNGVDTESAAWHMLACERDGPPEICTIMNSDLADACIGATRCGNTNHEVDVVEYYQHAHPELFDSARARYEELKAELAQGRHENIELRLNLTDPAE